MKYSTKPFDPKSLGYFILFSVAPEKKFQLTFHDRSPLRATLTVTLPSEAPEKWVSGFSTVLRHLQGGNYWPIRLEYDNALLYFSMEALQKIEKAHNAIPFYLYGVPDGVVDAKKTSNIDFNQLRNKLARERYAAEREQRILERNTRLHSESAQ